MTRIAILFCLLLAIVVAAPRKKKPPTIAGRIIGGRDTDIKEVPYQVSLQFQKEHDCGGSIIGDKYILTAAHCVEDGTASDYSVRAGSNEHATGGDTRKVKKIIPHSKFNNETLENDIAVLELDSPLKYSDKISKIELADKEPKEGEKVLITGWGILQEESRSRSKDLKSVIVAVVNKKTCQTIHQRKSLQNDKVFCAGVMSGGKDACNGDSGGPAIVNGKQAGIVSWGDGCGRKNSPGVYTNIAKFKSWIKSQTR